MIYTTYNVLWIAVQMQAFYILVSHTATLIGSKNDCFFILLYKRRNKLKV